MCRPFVSAGAITFEEREAPAYDEAAVKASQAAKKAAHSGGCPGSRIRMMAERRPETAVQGVPGQLTNWPVQLKLAPVNAPYFDGCHLLVAADCAAYTYGDFHGRFLAGRKLLIGCPKLDGVDYTEKLAAVLQSNDIRSVTLLRMEVPCCGGLEYAVRAALARSGKDIPLTVQVVNIDGTLA